MGNEPRRTSPSSRRYLLTVVVWVVCSLLFCVILEVLDDERSLSIGLWAVLVSVIMTAAFFVTVALAWLRLWLRR